ncbi:MAG: stage II sporulation protein M [Candidatus Bathyarchaeia archaeon]
MLCLFGFAFSMFAGYYLGDTISMEILEEVMGGLPDLEGFDLFQIFLFIVFNNVTKSFFWMLLGVLGGLPPMFFAVLNGFFIGHFSYNVALDYSLGFIAAALIPHGVIEISTILLSSAAGMSLGYALINRLRGHGGLRAELGKALLLYFTKILPLLILAAVLEVTLTPMVVALLGFV